MLQQLEPVSRSEWGSWKQERCTKRLIAGLAIRRNELLDAWGNASFSTREEELRAQGQVQSLVHTLQYILDTFDYIQEDKKENGDQSRST